MQSEGYANYRCNYCGAKLVFDEETHSYVCPVCGIVYGYEMFPSYDQLMHSAPLEPPEQSKLDVEIIERASKLFGESVAAELSKMDKTHAEEVLGVLEAIVKKRNYKASWMAVRRAVEIASKHKLKVDLDELREKRIYEEIEKFVKEAGLDDVNPKEVWYFALKYKRIWAGRKSSTLAKIFTYLYCRKKLGRDIKLEGKVLKVAKALEKVLDYE